MKKMEVRVMEGSVKNPDMKPSRCSVVQRRGTGKSKFIPAPGVSVVKSGKWREWSVTGNVVLSRRVSEPFWFRQDAGIRNAKTPLVNPLTREACMKYLNTTDCSLFLAERSKFMTKYALIGSARRVRHGVVYFTDIQGTVM
ncbi:hypothetical protein [Escherichia coli]|uniref:hypothetical protein n=1 Tax=Escherichia coli TaxID=562 RepID=UPI003F4E2425